MKLKMLLARFTQPRPDPKPVQPELFDAQVRLDRLEQMAVTYRKANGKLRAPKR